jgi:hypothetical protein
LLRRKKPRKAPRSIVDRKIHRLWNDNFIGLFTGARLQGFAKVSIQTCSVEIASPVSLR